MKIHRGITRTVFLVGKYAIKVPRLKGCKGHKAWTFVRGWSANMSEYDWSYFANTNYDQPQVCPVLKSLFGGIVNIYPRATIEWDEPKIDDIYDQIEFKNPSDVKPGNLGYWNGHAVWLDYDMNWNDCRHCGSNTCLI